MQQLGEARDASQTAMHARFPAIDSPREAGPFQSSAWLRHWLQHHGAGMETFPIVVNSGETVAPFGRLRIAGLRVLRLLGSGDSDFNGLMSTRGADAAWGSMVVELARRRREWDLLHLHSVAERDEIQSALERHLGRRSARGDHRSSLHGRAAACRRIRWRAPARVSGITLASHSWSHRNMARLADSELRDELVRPLTWLRERFEGVIPWLAYPDGLASPQAARIAEEVGCAAACGVRGGRSAVPPGERFSVPRLNIPAGLSPSCFALRTAGLFAA